MPAKPDLTYSCPDGIWWRLYPETDAGAEAWRVMAEADPQGVVAFLEPQLPGVLHQLRKAGYVVHKAKPAKPGDIDAILAELDAWA